VILDTNALSALADGADGVQRAADGTAALALPVIVLGEYRFGIAGSRHRARYEEWLSRLVAGSRVLDVDEQTAVRYAAIRDELRAAGRPIPSNDTWIAALARQHRLAVLSRDAHFDEVRGLRRVSW
jgi:predicted nucleic acid-binding protein